MKKEMGLFIKKLREDRGMSIYDLAHTLKEKVTLIEKWESGKRLPKRIELNSLSQIFDVPVNEFYQNDLATYTKLINIQNYRVLAFLGFMVLLMFLDIPSIKETQFFFLRGECKKEVVEEVYTKTVDGVEMFYLHLDAGHDIEFWEKNYCIPVEADIEVELEKVKPNTVLLDYFELDMKNIFRTIVQGVRVEESGDSIRISFEFIYDETVEPYREKLVYNVDISDVVG